MTRLLFFFAYSVRDVFKWALIVAYYVVTAPIGLAPFILSLGYWGIVYGRDDAGNWIWIPHGFQLWIRRVAKETSSANWQAAVERTKRPAEVDELDTLLRIVE